MNIITKLREAWVSSEGAREKAQIGPEERARGKAAVDYARGSVRLEGFIVSPFAEDLNRRYIDGEITSAELTALLFAYHKQ
jgi:hypothetical protein